MLRLRINRHGSVSTIKLDRLIIPDRADTANQDQITPLGVIPGTSMIAEGVETHDQLSRVRFGTWPR
jgi:hypothetical protein